MIHLAPKDLSLGSLRLGRPQPHTLLLEVLTHISRVAEEGGHMHFFHIHCPFSSNILPPKQGQNEMMCFPNNHQIKLKSSNFTQVVIIIYLFFLHSLTQSSTPQYLWMLTLMLTTRCNVSGSARPGTCHQSFQSNGGHRQ